MRTEHNWKKRAESLVLTGVLLAGLAACAGGSSAGQSTPKNSTTLSESTRNLMEETDKAVTDVADIGKETSGTENSTESGESEASRGTLPAGSEKKFAENYCNFAVELLKQNIASGENAMVSPLSVAAALSVTANGAGGDTLSQMEQVLAQGQSIDEWNGMLADWINGLPDDEGAHISVADSIWFKEKDGFSVKEDFLQKNRETFQTDVYAAPFDSQTLVDINKWVNDNTDGMIPEILGEIPENAVMYLLNAVAFEAEWKKIYTENQIGYDRKFTKSDGTVQSVDMMYSRENWFLEEEHATGFIKPYVSGYSFAVLLPEEGMDVYDYVNQLTGEKLQNILENSAERNVETGLPAFEVSYEAELSDMLVDMGMEDAFDSSKADFSGMASFSDESALRIGKVFHKTYIKVDAKGTKAGAATAVEMTMESAAVEEIPVVICNRPFVYVIIEQESGLPVFIGVLEQLDET
jgi:serpin B